MELAVLETRRLRLRPIEDGDMKLLHRWRNDPRFLALCSVRRTVVGFEDFTAELRRDFERDRHLQLMIELKSKSTIIGTVYSYNLNLIDGNIFLTIYLEEEYERKGYGAETVAIFLDYLFATFPLHKIYFEVYDYNRLSLSTLQTAGFVEEGRFKEHRFVGGKRYDLIRFAFFREGLVEMRNKRVLRKLKGGVE